MQGLKTSGKAVVTKFTSVSEGGGCAESVTPDQ